MTPSESLSGRNASNSSDFWKKVISPKVSTCLWDHLNFFIETEPSHLLLHGLFAHLDRKALVLAGVDQPLIELQGSK